MEEGAAPLAGAVQGEFWSADEVISVCGLEISKGCSLGLKGLGLGSSRIL